MFTYLLYLETGTDVGAFTTPIADWSVGDVFATGGQHYRIVGIVAGEHLSGERYAGLFKVAPVSDDEAERRDA